MHEFTDEALAEHDRQVRDQTVDDVVALLNSQVGGDEITEATKLAATTILWWHRAQQLKEEA